MAFERIKSMFGQTDRPRYSFELVNNSLLRDDRKEIIRRIAATKAAEGIEQAKCQEALVAYVAELFEGVSTEATSENLADFIRTYATTEAEAIAAEMAVNQVNVTQSEATPAEMTEAEARGEYGAQIAVPQPRRVTNDPFAGLAPVAVAPRTPEQKGEDAMARLIAEAEAAGAPQKTEIPVLPEDGPRHRASEDSIHGADDTVLTWSPEGPDSVVPKPPQQTL